MAQNILLVAPAFSAGGGLWTLSKYQKRKGIKCLEPPLGLVTVASMLPDDCSLRLVDINLRPLEDEDLGWADLLFVGGMISQDHSIREVIAQAQAAKVPVVAGGPHATTSYADLPGIDYLIWGEAEGLIECFWNDYRQGKAKACYAAPLKQGDKQRLEAFFGENKTLIDVDDLPDLAQTPLPRFDLLEMSSYGSMSVQSSRGCPVACEFCDIWRRFGRKPRYKPAERILEELNELYRLGWRGKVFIVDDNFIGNKRRVKSLLLEMKRWQNEHGNPFKFYTEATANLGDDDELLDLMWSAGFYLVFLGIETPVEEALREMNKQINLSRSMIDRVSRIQARGINVTAGFIVGFDSDPNDIAQRMVEHVNELAIPFAVVTILQPLPETDLWDRLKREGRLLDKGSTGLEHQIHFSPMRPVEVVIRDYHNILQSLYSTDLSGYFARCSELRERIGRPSGKEVSLLNSLAALFSPSMFLLLANIGTPHGRAAVKYVFTTLFKKWWYVPTTIRQCFNGFHLRDVARRLIGDTSL